MKLAALSFSFTLAVSNIFAQNPASDVPHRKGTEVFAVQGWVHAITTFRSFAELVKGTMTKEQYDLIVAAEYRNLFVCWVACEGQDSIIRDLKDRKLLTHFVRQIYRKMINESPYPEDPLCIFLQGKDVAPQKLQIVVEETVGDAMPIPQFASVEAYQAAVVRFRADCANK